MIYFHKYGPQISILVFQIKGFNTILVGDIESHPQMYCGYNTRPNIYQNTHVSTASNQGLTLTDNNKYKLWSSFFFHIWPEMGEHVQQDYFVPKGYTHCRWNFCLQIFDFKVNCRLYVMFPCSHILRPKLYAI